MICSSNILRQRICHLFAISKIEAGNPTKNMVIRSKSAYSQYSHEQVQTILTILNSSDESALLRYNLSDLRSTNIINYRNTVGQFKDINDLLNVKGLGVNVLQKICDNIITGSSVIEKMKTEPVKRVSTVNLVSPELSEARIQNLKNITAVHIGLDTISWANLNVDGVLLDWNLRQINCKNNKANSTGLLELVVESVYSMKETDLFVFESDSHLPSSSNLQKLQLTSMLHGALTLKYINDLHSLSGQGIHKVCFLKPLTAARVFGILIGNERVSSLGVVEDIMKGTSSDQVKCSPVTFNPILKSEYEAKDVISRDMLGNALILSVVFMDIIVHKKRDILANVKNFKRK